jgi:hypothetical protein
MQNVTMRIDGNKLVIELDLTKEIGPRRPARRCSSPRPRATRTCPVSRA